MEAAGVPTAGSRTCTTAGGGRGRAGRLRGAVRRQGRRARRRQGRRRHPRPRRGARARGGLRPGRDRGVPRRARGLGVRDLRRDARRTPCSRPRTSSGSSTAAAGPNTGGMGSYTPLTWAQPDLSEVVLERVVRPTLAEMAGRGTPFVGCLYVGLALTDAGPRVIEFNVRFGDPDIQPVLAVLDSPLGELLAAAAEGRLAEVAGPGLPRRRRGDGRARLGRLPRVLLEGRRHHRRRPRRRARGRRRHPRRYGALRRRPGHRRRPGARRPRASARTSPTPARRRTPPPT